MNNTLSARKVFERAIEERSPADWAAFVPEACGGDTTLAAEVERLLDAHRAAGDFMAEPALPTGPALGYDMTGDTIGPYHLVEKIGEGGMGVVYVAEQKHPVRRQVALKVIKPGMDSRQVIARFEAERQALAMMEHPHIARIFDAGTTEGRPYFVMELVRGVSITDYCHDAKLSLQERLRLFVTVCRAVQHAHQRGIIHRDLKPQNLLVTQHDGRPTVKVIDFGVAKATSAGLTDQTVHTAFAQLVGTPLYMSPEQMNLSGLDIDTRSDVYSLGVLLYELLTGQTPVNRDTLRKVGFDEFRRMMREDDPPRPSARLANTETGVEATTVIDNADQRRRAKRLRGELDWIVMKALEKDRTRRYESANALADDIERFLNDLPIHARPPSAGLRLRKWSRRHPLLAFGILAAVVLSAAIVAGDYRHHRELMKSLAVSNQLREAGLVREYELRQQLVASDMQLAWRSATAGNIAEGRTLLRRNITSDNAFEEHGFAWRYVNNLCREPLHVYAGHAAPLLAADLSPDDRWLASGDRGGELKIWDVASGKIVQSRRYAEKEICAIRFSPDGKWLATAGQDQRVHVWDVSTWQEVAELRGHKRTIYALAWSPDSHWLASGGRDARINIWDAATHENHQTLSDPGGEARAVRALAWSADGRFLAAAKGHQELLILNTAIWETARALPGLGDEQSIMACDFSPDDRYVAYGGYGGKLRVYDLIAERELPPVDAFHQVYSLAFANSGELIVGGGRGSSQVFELWRTPPRLHSLRLGVGETDTLRGVIPSHDGEFLITAGEQTSVLKRWNTAAFLGKTRVASEQRIFGVIDQRWTASFDEQHVYIRNFNDHKLLATLPYGGWPRPVPAYCARRKLLAVADKPNHIQMWDVETWQPRDQFSLTEGALCELAFSADDRWLIASCEGGRVGMWDVATGKWRETHSFQVGEDWSKIAASPTADIWAVEQQRSKNIELWRINEAEPFARFTIGTFVNSLRFSPDGNILAVGDSDNAISLWNPQDGKPLGTLRGHTDDLRMIAFSPDATVLASASRDSTLRLWSLATRRELFVLYQHQYPFSVVEFLSSGKLAAVDDDRHELLIFDAGEE